MAACTIASCAGSEIRLGPVSPSRVFAAGVMVTEAVMRRFVAVPAASFGDGIVCVALAKRARHRGRKGHPWKGINNQRAAHVARDNCKGCAASRYE
jgi:hypothetical protein